jgi:hypothetical protein
MNVNRLQSSVYAAMSKPPAEVSGLSSEAMLAYCETRLRDIDQGVEAQMNDQITIMNRKKAVNTVLTKAKAKSEKPGAESRESVYKAAEQAASCLPEGDPVRKKLEGLRDKYEDGFADASGDKLKEKWADFKANLETLTSELGADSEMSMMKLQSIVSQRQTIVSLITNIMAKMQQATEQVVANVKA